MSIIFTPIQSDISEANAKLKVLYDAYNALEAKIGNVVTPIPTPTPIPATETQVITIGEQQFWKEIRTANYSKIFNDGGTVGAYRMGGYATYGNNSDNNKYDRPDQPFIIASYNALPNNGRDFKNEYNWDITVEPFWWNPTLNELSLEAHIFRSKDRRGIEHRHISFYTGILTGNTFTNMETSSLNLFSKAKEDFPVGVTPEAYLSAYAGQIVLFDVENNNAGVKLKNKSGLTSIFNQFGDVPVLDMPKSNSGDAKSSFHWDGFGHFKLKIKVPFNSNQEAINNGLELGDSYWLKTTLNGQLVTILAQVQ